MNENLKKKTTTILMRDLGEQLKRDDTMHLSIGVKPSGKTLGLMRAIIQRSEDWGADNQTYREQEASRKKQGA